MNAKAMSVDDVMREIKKDRHYYEQSGGGVTFSGGECLLHREFLLEVLKKCKSEGIHTAIESALFVPAETLREVTPLVDLFFADLKIADSEKHRKYTGHDNELIIRNLDYLSRNAKRLIIRIPLIPSVNDSEEDIIGFARIISGFGDRIEGVEVLKYNYLGKSKYEQMGMQFSDFGDKTQTNEFMEEYTKALSEKIKGKAPVYYRK
jgi:pyruvate formate lyase activating enzyme